MNICKVIDFGVIDYPSGVKLQKELVRLRKIGLAPDTIILAEHPHTYTIGRTGNISNLLEEMSELRKNNIGLFYTDRGGDITYHGPGQIVVYPIFDLNLRLKDIKKYLRSLENAIIAFLRAYGVIGSRREGLTGVWVGLNKIASIGVSFTGWISYHGFAVNINNDMSYFERINPCGMKDNIMISLSEIINNKVDILAAKHKIVEAISEAFDINEVKYENSEYLPKLVKV